MSYYQAYNYIQHHIKHPYFLPRLHCVPFATLLYINDTLLPWLQKQGFK